MSDFIDKYTDRQRRKREELKQEYEMKLEQERRICKAMVEDLERELRVFRGQYNLIDR
jgi:hypothetical protein